MHPISKGDQFWWCPSLLFFADHVVVWPHQTVTSNLYMNGLQLSGKRQVWRSGPLKLRPWLSVKGGSPTLGWERVAATSGGVQESWGLVHVKGQWGGRLTDECYIGSGCRCDPLRWRESRASRQSSKFTVYVPNLIYGYELWVLIKRMRLQI